MNIKVFENFLKNEDFNDLIKIPMDFVGKTNIKIYHNAVNHNGIIKSENINSDLLLRLHKNYHSFAINLLKKLNPKKVNLYEYSEFSLIITGSNYKFPIHDDTPDKLLSGVIYLFPEKNTGTIFYENKNGENKKIIEWRQNRAVFFSRNEKETWHSYEGDGISNRVALVYNLMTKNLKDVYKVEKKNYFLGNLRYKINPYLYKFFKKTI